MLYDLVVILCAAFAIILTLFGFYTAYAITIGIADALVPNFYEELWPTIVRWSLMFVTFPLATGGVFFFLIHPIMWAFGFGLIFAFHGH